MKVAAFSALAFERPCLEQANGGRHERHFPDTALDATTVALTQGSDAVCVFTPAAHRSDPQVANVPGYSPHAIAQHGLQCCSPGFRIFSFQP